MQEMKETLKDILNISFQNEEVNVLRFLPLNKGTIRHIVIGPCLWNCPRTNSMKNNGRAERISTEK